MTGPCATDYLRAQDAVPDPDHPDEGNLAPRRDLLVGRFTDDDPPTAPR